MDSLIGTFLAGMGLLVAAAALLVLVVASGLSGGSTAGPLVVAAAGVFLVGVMTFGYGVGKRTVAGV